MQSPIEKSTAALRNFDPKWIVEIGAPHPADGWIRGTDFARGTDGPFPALLNRIGERLRTTDRLTIAASFSLRFAWSSWVAIIPYVVNRVVPDISLHNISLKFGANTLHERTALYVARESGSSLRDLRMQLLAQTQPMVDALYAWSGFSKKGSWGQITSSWTSHFVNTYARLGSQTNALPILQAFFEGDDEISRMQPTVNPLSVAGQTHVYQRRASCCRYYLLPQGSLCASCPLVSDEERIARDIEFFTKQMSSRSR